MNVFRLAAIALVPFGTAAAQGATTCDIEEGKPQKVALASFNLQRAFAAAKPEDKAKILRDVVKQVTEPDKKNENPTGRAYILAKSLILFASQPELIGTATPTKGQLGFAVDQAAPADLLVIADSVFTMIEKTNPGCVADISQWRHQQPWFRLVQESFGALQSQKYAEAADAARRSLVINRASAYAPYVLGTVAANAKDFGAATQNYARAIELAASDTAYADIKRRSMLEIGRINSELAQAPGGDKPARSRDAIAAFTAYLTEVPTAPDAPQVRRMLADLYVDIGDSASVQKVYADLLANPTKYDDIALTQAGVIPTMFNRSDDAARLFAAALDNNPYQRDALSNLAAMYFALNKFQEMLPVVDRLVKVDPGNPDNWLLFAFAYQGLQRVAKTPAQKKALTDSLIKYNKRSEDMPVKVGFTAFSRGDSTSLAGTVQNLGTTPKSFALEFEFLDRAGAVVEKATVRVDDVAKAATKPFSVKVGAKGITGYRYSVT